MIEENRNTKLKITIDVFSGISLIFLIIIFPILSHYYPRSVGDDGKMLILIKLVLLNLIPSIFAVIWLPVRYGEIIAKKILLFLSLVVVGYLPLHFYQYT